MDREVDGSISDGNNYLIVCHLDILEYAGAALVRIDAVERRVAVAVGSCRGIASAVMVAVAMGVVVHGYCYLRFKCRCPSWRMLRGPRVSRGSR